MQEARDAVWQAVIRGRDSENVADRQRSQRILEDLAYTASVREPDAMRSANRVTEAKDRTALTDPILKRQADSILGNLCRNDISMEKLATVAQVARTMYAHGFVASIAEAHSQTDPDNASKEARMEAASRNGDRVMNDTIEKYRSEGCSR